MTPPSQSASLAATRHRSNSNRTLYEKIVDWLTQQGVSTVLLFLGALGVWIKGPEIAEQISKSNLEAISQFREERKIDREQHRADLEFRDKQFDKLAGVIKEQTSTLIEEFRRSNK